VKWLESASYRSISNAHNRSLSLVSVLFGFNFLWTFEPLPLNITLLSFDLLVTLRSLCLNSLRNLPYSYAIFALICYSLRVCYSSCYCFLLRLPVSLSPLITPVFLKVLLEHILKGCRSRYKREASLFSAYIYEFRVF
jgi:hypothetical protein